MTDIAWVKGCPPTSGGTYLLKFHGGAVCSGEYRAGRLGEPQQGEIVWRCDCCGRFATPEYWARYDSGASPAVPPSTSTTTERRKCNDPDCNFPDCTCWDTRKHGTGPLTGDY